MKHLLRTLVCTFLLGQLSSVVAAPVNVLTYHNDEARTGQNLSESILAISNVKTSTFAKLFTYSVDGYVYAQPLYVSGLQIPGKGIHNVLFIATEHNSVYAFDADSKSGANNGLLWHVNLGISAVTPNADFGTRYNGGQYTDIVPEVGITGTPVIDLAAGTMYLDAFTHEGSSYFHRIHALALTNGAERANSPVMVNIAVNGTGVGSVGGKISFTHKQQLQRAAMTLAGGILYATYTGYADTDPYHGWILGFNPVTLQLRTNYVFISTPNSSVAAFGANAGEGGIWMGGNGLAVDSNTNIYFEVGNGSFTATNNAGGTEYGDSFMKLSTTNGLSVIDYFTPYNQATLAANDTDLGSAGLMLLPDQSGPFPHLLLGNGKEGKMYLINRDLMSTNNNHYNSTGTVDNVVQSIASQSGRSFSTPAYFNGRVYYAGSGAKAKTFSISGGLLSTTATSTGARTFAFPGATLSVSANGSTDGIVWGLWYTNTTPNPGVLVAFNATNLTTEIYNSSQATGNRDLLTNGVKFAAPTIANGKVYVGGQYTVSVFGLNDPTLLWRTAHFGANATNLLIAGDLADPDSDGAPNLLEYALASDPNLPGSNNSLNGNIVAGHFFVSFPRNATATDLTYVIESSSTLSTWSPVMTFTSATGWVANVAGALASEAPPSSVPPDQSIAVSIDTGTISQTSQFFRLRIHR